MVATADCESVSCSQPAESGWCEVTGPSYLLNVTRAGFPLGSAFQGMRIGLTHLRLRIPGHADHRSGMMAITIPG